MEACVNLGDFVTRFHLRKCGAQGERGLFYKLGTPVTEEFSLNLFASPMMPDQYEPWASRGVFFHTFFCL